VHAAAIRDEALALIEQGVNDCEIARRLGVPRTTVRDWRRPRYVPRVASDATCTHCGRRTRPIAFSPADYAELLGLYLGDGHISEGPRTERLRLTLDAAHPKVAAESEALLRRVFPGNRVGRFTAHEGRMVVLYVYSGHLSCLFPQHGAGQKHKRRIALEPWQQEIVSAAPWDFLRGCIRSDGCVFINRTGPYEYLSYDFANWSADILDLFVDTCVALGLRPRRYEKHVRLYRRADVVQLVERVGLKG
jgi:hypothetical protein